MHGLFLVLVVRSGLTVLVIMAVADMLVVRVVAMILIGITRVVVVGLAVVLGSVTSSSGSRCGVTILIAVAIFVVLSLTLVPLV
jgi:hypothetical protein